MSTRFLLVMDDLGDHFYQAPSMDQGQAEATLRALAKLHAHFWGSCDVINSMERGGFWVLERRKVTKGKSPLIPHFFVTILGSMV